MAEIYGFELRIEDLPYGSDHYLATGEFLPDAVFESFATDFDAIFLGAIGDPRVEPGLVERQIIARIRFGLDLYINYRPIVLYSEHLCPLKDRRPEDIDMVVIRENTEDAYTGLGGIFKRGTPDEIAVAEMIYSRKGCERAIRYAFEVANRVERYRRVTLVDKANAIRAQDIWTRAFADVGAEYPDIESDHAYIDAACMWMVKNPDFFDVIVVPNLFGDILTDLGAMIQGGMGIAASANLHPGRTSMFEPIHGSAPKYRGQNRANPLAAIAAAQLMLEHIGEGVASAHLERAIRRVLVERRLPSIDARSGFGTDQIGDLILTAIHEQ
jgi:3-isopropylmalate dehydrogenase